MMNSGLCCPDCGNRDLQVTTETKTQTTGSDFSVGKGCLGYLLFGPLGILCGACGQGKQTTTTNTTYWVCPKCGKKFRNPEDMRRELENQKKTIPIMVIFGIIFTVLLLLFVPKLLEDAAFIGVLLSLIPVAIFGIASFATYKSIETGLENVAYEESRMKKHLHDASNSAPRSYQANRPVNAAPVEVNFCPKCGSKVANPTASFCAKCGATLREKQVSQAPLQTSLSPGEWRCPRCGKVHQSYVGTCGCGQTKLY